MFTDMNCYTLMYIWIYDPVICNKNGHDVSGNDVLES